MSDFFLIERVFVSSMLHLDDEDLLLIEYNSWEFGAPFELSSEGFYIDVSDSSKRIMEEHSPSEGFNLVFLMAESLNCDKINFRPHGKVYDGIPIYEC